MVTRRKITGFLLAVLATVAFYVVALRSPPGPRSLKVFDPDRMADLEVGMWQAYYRKAKPRLFLLLVTMMHEQYRYTWSRACRAGFHLARAAAIFGDSQSDYDRVLPDLERAYSIAKDWSGAHYDPAAVARAELAWWVARRAPAESSPENVGRLIGKEYALFYEVPEDRVHRVGLLRAQAAALRDAGGADADWDAVSHVLHDSYRSLNRALASPGSEEWPTRGVTE